MTETATMTAADVAEKIEEFLRSKLTADELKAFSFGRSPVVNGYAVSLNGHEFILSEVNLRNLTGSEDQIEARAFGLIRRLRSPRQFAPEENKYTPTEVTIFVADALRKALAFLDPKAATKIESDLIREDPESAMNMYRRSAILAKRFLEHLEGVANG